MKINPKTHYIVRLNDSLYLSAPDSFTRNFELATKYLTFLEASKMANRNAGKVIKVVTSYIEEGEFKHE